MAEKTCIKCGFVGDEALFTKNQNSCKKCTSEYKKQYRLKQLEKYNPNEIKTCIHCGIVGKASELFRIGRKQCKKCEYKYTKAWRKNHPDETRVLIKNSGRRYYKNHKLKELNRQKKYRTEHPDYAKKYYAKNPEKVLKNYRKYRKTPKGKACDCRCAFKRRNLGHEPINLWFKGSEAHHLRYSKTIEKQDNNITLYVPRKLHRSIPHNGNTGQGMRDINIACLEWYFEVTPEEEQNPKALKLYNNYLTLPEPKWVGDEQSVITNHLS